ncbi:hypothetical protein LPJ66_000333 [Kickxella alabastrina]|uniref:Uncharacterized protein n=1 Tax=Kickxella alabastrina TaxID=61397 RepID=A0ACC1IWB4_9FUNG|nr:hypothetical protein LPJ66_000333 [Kickxella alabastrina]
MTISAPASKTDKPVDGSTQDQGNSANQPSQLVDKIITALRIQLAAKDERLSAKDAVIAANNAVIAAKDVWLSIKDPLLATKDAELEEIFVKVETLTARVAELETIAHHHRKYIGTADTADPTVLQCADKDIATSEDEPVQPDAQPAAVGTSGPDTADNSSDACMTNVAEIIPVPPFMEWSQPVADSEPYSIMELLYCPICVPICVAVVDFKEDKSSIDLSLVISCIPPGQRPDIIVAYGVECSALDDLDNWTFKSTTSSVGSNKFVVGWNKSKLRGTIDDPVLRCNNIKFTVCQTIYDPLVLQFINIGSKQGFVGEESLTRPLYKSINRQRKLVFGNAFDIKGNKGRVSHGLDGLIYDYRHGKLRYNSQAISDDNTSTPGNIGWTEYPTLQCVINIFPLTEITRRLQQIFA